MNGQGREAVATQLADELHVRYVASLATIVGPSIMDTGLPAMLHQAAQQLAMQLDGPAEDGDDREQVQTAIDIMNALWGQAGPEDGWWRTPLGRRCARALAHESTEAITYQQAASMLGVTRGTVSQLVHRGTLDRHPDGGVLLASVYQRLAGPSA